MMFDLENELADRLSTLPDGPKPRDIACDYCGAKVGSSCRTTSSYPARTHIARWEAVGMPKPGYIDLERDTVDGQLRDLRRKIENLPDMSWLKRHQQP